MYTAMMLSVVMTFVVVRAPVGGVVIVVVAPIRCIAVTIVITRWIAGTDVDSASEHQWKEHGAPC